ncbi:MAG: hypothetical protein GY814_03695 [Gammaproteobacteria bacterium]|nr:hypothetical protein [Gammaproteobacteria bacterium]
MSQAKLILSQSPPAWVPLRFFVTAPVFAIAAAVLVLWYEPTSLASRWSAPVLAFTHLLVIGFMAMVMTGALIQVVSVLLGGKIHRIRNMSLLLHTTLSLGTISLAMGFISSEPWFMRSAVVLLASWFGLFIWATLGGIGVRTARSDSAMGIGLALFALSITTILGLWLAVGYGWEQVPLARSLTDTHLTWGLLGWVGILLITVAYEVVPMFQLTPPYPKKMPPWLAPVHILALVLCSSTLVVPGSILPLIGGVTVAMTLSLFAVVTLRLQSRRKKKKADAVVWFWRCGMLSAIAATSIWLYAQTGGGLLQQQEWQMLLGAMVILGFAISLINGMLYKIIPFLIWVHLSIRVTEQKLSRRMVPNIKKMIPDTRARFQFWLHLFALVLFLATTFRPEWFLIPAAGMFALSNILLLHNITLALRLYSRTEIEIAQAGIEG